MLLLLSAVKVSCLFTHFGQFYIEEGYPRLPKEKSFGKRIYQHIVGKIYRNIFKMKTKFSTELQSIFIISNIIFFFIIWHFLAISCLFFHIFHNSGKTLLPWMNLVLIITPFLSPRLILKIGKKIVNSTSILNTPPFWQMKTQDGQWIPP